MQFLELNQTERDALEKLRISLVAAAKPEAVLDTIPVMLADVNRPAPSMLTLAGALEPAAQAIGFAIEAVQIYLGKIPCPTDRINIFPTVEEFEEAIKKPAVEATNNERTGYQLDCARRFLIAHTMKRCRWDAMTGTAKTDILDSNTGQSAGRYYAVHMVSDLLGPKVANLANLTGEEAYEFLKYPLRPVFEQKTMKAETKPTRQ